MPQYLVSGYLPDNYDPSTMSEAMVEQIHSKKRFSGGKTMRENKVGAIVIQSFALLVVLGTVRQAMAQDATTPYPKTAPIEEYLMDRTAETTLARSAAPESISRDATILVLGLQGYETAAKGTNGFVCLVVRMWAAGFDEPEFWNPKVRAPHCFNAAAARSVLPAYLKRTELVLAGLTKEQVLEHMKAEVAKKVFVAPEVGSMCYMMSKQGYLNDKDGHWHPHLMFFLPPTEAAKWGANVKGAAIYAATGNPELVTTFFVPVAKWSDGTADSADGH
ncbi:MAG TPA: hypothetical protein VIX90_06490 [Edaphobacter sp.]